MKALFALTLLALLPICPSANGQSNLLVNGGFDSGASGWTATNISGTGYVSAGGNPPGCFYLSSASTSTVPAISQQISSLIIGSRYVVAGEYRSGGKGFAANSFGVALDGVYSFLASSPADYNWHSFSFEYSPTSTSARLSVAAQLNGTDYPYYIDNLVVQLVPSLVIQSTGTNVLLSWPTNGLHFGLQAATNLNVATWADVTNTPAVVGAGFSVSLSASRRVQFFRLKR